VTPDGSGVVFEVTDEFQLIERTPLAPEQRGFFYVRADGSGLRRLGPPSRDPTYRIYLAPLGFGVNFYETYLAFSPSGRLVAYTDRVAAPDGSAATGISILDVGTGRRRRPFLVTTLLPAFTPSGERSVAEYAFLDERTIRFRDRTQEGQAIYTVRTDASGLRRAAPLPQVPESVSASPVAPVFGVTRPTGSIVSLALRATAEDPNPSYRDPRVVEVFRIDGGNLLQVTAFGRNDSRGVGGGGLSDRPVLRGSRVLLIASTDPFGENPFKNCQLFSIDPWGNGLRQLTDFDEGAASLRGCTFGAPPGCSFADVYQDPVTRWIVFYSNCHRFDSSFYGTQVFAMRPDGRRLRQLTHTAGARWVGDEVQVEIPGPIAYSMPIR
jgi:hypothetical protein